LQNPWTPFFNGVTAFYEAVNLHTGVKIMIKNKDRTPVAQDLITMCPKCKMELNHLVLFLNMKGKVERVKCHTCGSEHKYHPDKKKVLKKTVKTAKKGVRTKKVDFAKNFETLAEKFKDKKPVPYSMSGSFKEDDVIDHTTFGMGFVASVSYQKMEVAFSGGPRLLVCNRQEIDVYPQKSASN